jgi:hypothetical protein
VVLQQRSRVRAPAAQKQRQVLHIGVAVSLFFELPVPLVHPGEPYVVVLDHLLDLVEQLPLLQLLGHALIMSNLLIIELSVTPLLVQFGLLPKNIVKLADLRTALLLEAQVNQAAL